MYLKKHYQNKFLNSIMNGKLVLLYKHGHTAVCLHEVMMNKFSPNYKFDHNVKRYVGMFEPIKVHVPIYTQSLVNQKHVDTSTRAKIGHFATLVNVSSECIRAYHDIANHISGYTRYRNLLRKTASEINDKYLHFKVMAVWELNSMKSDYNSDYHDKNNLKPVDYAFSKEASQSNYVSTLTAMVNHAKVVVDTVLTAPSNATHLRHGAFDLSSHLKDILALLNHIDLDSVGLQLVAQIIKDTYRLYGAYARMDIDSILIKTQAHLYDVELVLNSLHHSSK